MRGRNFRRGCVMHIYQRAADKGVIFYTVADRLVYYTTCASVMAKYGIPCYAASIMFTHVHFSCIPESPEQLEACIRDASSSFARAYNHEHKRNGELFDRPFGSSVKWTTKEARSNLLYVFNNHVEKKICRTAVEERWSFLAFSLSSHPFSEALSESNMSKRLRRGLNLVDRHAAKRQPLKYSDINAILKDLNQTETQQYIDYVIKAYRLVDFSYGTKLFGSIRDMIDASETVTGDEWDIHEDFYGFSDIVYSELCQLFPQSSIECRNSPMKSDIECCSSPMKSSIECRSSPMRGNQSIYNLYQMNDEQKMSLVIDAMKHVQANGAQLSRFFHCNLPWK